jgi:Fe-S-cluster containining protein
MPGMLDVKDVRVISEESGFKDPESDECYEFVTTHFAASEGALVSGPMGVVRVPTIVPQQRDDGTCVFFDRDSEQCKIHSVAPYGCRMVDYHMSKGESDKRMLPALYEVYHDDFYQGLVSLLYISEVVDETKNTIAPSLLERRRRAEELIAEVRQEEIMEAECN